MTIDRTAVLATVLSRRNALIAAYAKSPEAATHDLRLSFWGLYRDLKRQHPGIGAGDVHQALREVQRLDWQSPVQPTQPVLTADAIAALTSEDLDRYSADQLREMVETAHGDLRAMQEGCVHDPDLGDPNLEAKLAEVVPMLVAQLQAVQWLEEQDRQLQERGLDGGEADRTGEEYLHLVPAAYDEDLRQDAILALLQGKPTSEEDARRIIRSVQSRERYRRRRTTNYQSTAPVPDMSIDTTDWLSHDVCLALEELPEYDRGLLTARYVEGKSDSVIAQRLQVSRRTVLRHVHAALEKLRTLVTVDALPTPMYV